jgi:5-methyltetrahydrofolate--homocysteine methyltransferase
LILTVLSLLLARALIQQEERNWYPLCRKDDVKLLPETIRRLQESFDIPLCLDSPNPRAIEAALKAAAGKCLINSVNGEEASLKNLLPLAKEYGAAIIGLCMDDDGITHDPEKRVSIAEKIIERALKVGIKPEDVIIDPLAMAVSADPNACLVTLEQATFPSGCPTGNP